MVIDHGMDVVIAHPVAAVAGGAAMLVRVAAMDTVAAAVAQPPQLLDIHVDQLTGTRSLIAVDRLAAGSIHDHQPVQPMAAQHPVDGGGRQPNQGSDPGRAELPGPAQRQDGSLLVSWRVAGMVVGAAGPVDEPAGPACW